jgi:hypothetical protein
MITPAIATALSPAHTRIRRDIAAHFAGQISTAAETAMRAHLLTCAPCKSHYQRHLTLARLDPRSLPGADRIARGLGFRLRGSGPGRWRARLITGLALPAVAVSVAIGVLAVFPGRRPGRGRESVPTAGASADFAVRGTGVSAGRAEAFWTYRVGPEGTSRLANQAIRRGDELAFAYSNPLGKPFLMIFGVDEHRHVYWFHPAWTPGQPAPAAVRVVEGPGPHELPGAIHQALDGHRLTVYAAFSDVALRASAVEAALLPSAASDEPPGFGADFGESLVVLGRTYEVQP